MKISNVLLKSIVLYMGSSPDFLHNANPLTQTGQWQLDKNTNEIGIHR